MGFLSLLGSQISPLGKVHIFCAHRPLTAPCLLWGPSNLFADSCYPAPALGVIAQYPGLQSSSPRRRRPQCCQMLPAAFPHTARPACLPHPGAALITLPFFLDWAPPCPFSGSRPWRLQLLHGSSSSLEDMCCSWVLFHMSVGYNPRNPSPLPSSSVQERSCLLLLVHLPCWAAFHPWRWSIPFRLLFPPHLL